MHSNGPDGETDRVIAEIASGDRCGGCACAFDGETSELIGDRWYHRGKCADAARVKAPPPKPKPKRKRGRIKGADTTPGVEGL
jgi:hypothetical protein